MFWTKSSLLYGMRGKFLPMFFYRTSLARRFNINPQLNKTVRPLVVNEPPSALLYGDNLSEIVKSAKSLEGVSKELMISAPPSTAFKPLQSFQKREKPPSWSFPPGKLQTPGPTKESFDSEGHKGQHSTSAPKEGQPTDFLVSPIPEITLQSLSPIGAATFPGGREIVSTSFRRQMILEDAISTLG